MRAEFSHKTKVLAWQRSGGVCECGCGAKLYPGKTDYDHRIPCAMDRSGGDNSLDNCMVLARGHHLEKNKDDFKTIAKAKRRERKHAGIRKPSKFACSRDSKWKKKLDGTVVFR